VITGLDPSPTADDRPPAIPLTVPRDGIPPVISNPDSLADAVAAIAAGTGPVAIDTERASGFRYSQRAYLIQIRRADTGTFLIDPIGLTGLDSLAAALRGTEWILHAASQDLPCLAELGLSPDALFDTELAARLAGYPRVGLGAIVEELLGFSLEKVHSAADWSTRPLPEPWLAYAALDVEVLVELREALATELNRQGKLRWAIEEFAAILAAPPAEPRVDPWRRTSGVHRVRTPRQLAVVSELWHTRNAIAQDRDIAPGRLLRDTAIIDAALAMPTTETDLAELAVFRGRSTRRMASTWFAAIERARGAPTAKLPTVNRAIEGLPPPRSWSDRNPPAAQRLAAARVAVSALAEAVGMPPENLMSPESLRRISWDPPEPLDTAAVAAALRSSGARNWQVQLVADSVTHALASAETTPPGARLEP
jgi:ribonuclease D